MPEGPEVRTIADVLNRKVLNRKIKEIELSENAKVYNFDLYENYLSDRKDDVSITKISSYGKKLLIYLNNEIVIVFSLGMTGAFRFNKETHSHVIFHLHAGDATVDAAASAGDAAVEAVVSAVKSFNFTDTRRFGDATFLNIEDLDDNLSNLGPDLLEAALNTPISKKKWLEIFNQPSARGLKIGKRAICIILLEQNFVAGIGNYLKSEILYYSGILPDRLACDLSDEEWEKMRTVAHHIIKVSYLYGGLTIESYISPDGKMGKYPTAVYNKQKDPLGNKIIKGTTKDKRTSYWVDEIQQ
jgi:formamidopyrimidine-DNA glycosylase